MSNIVHFFYKFMAFYFFPTAGQQQPLYGSAVSVHPNASQIIPHEL